VRTDELIEELSSRAKPVNPFNVELRVAAGLGVGGALAVIAVALWLGIRPDLAQAAATPGFWMKFAFAGAVGVAAMALSCRLGRPGCRVRVLWWVVAAPIMLLAAAAIVQLAGASASERLRLWLGHSWMVCPVRIVVLSAPSFLGMLWAFRQLAPIELRLAGLGAGLAAGAVGASVYALTCEESSVAFLATWYSLGILAVGAIGAVFGPRVLRW